MSSKSTAWLSAILLIVVVGCSSTVAQMPSAEPTAPAEEALPVPVALADSIALKVAGDDQLSYLSQALEKSGLAKTLAGSTKYTLLAPTNTAFESLPHEALEALSDPETLRAVLAQHVLLGEIAEIELVTAGSVDTLAGTKLEVLLVVVEAVETCCGFDQALLINDIEAQWTNLDAANGQIYLIDKVIWPEALPES